MLQLHESITNFALNAIESRVQAMTGSRSNLNEFMSPNGDRGLFGPDSIIWEVHANFTAMMVGGLSSLMMQSLHPRALSAVWDHSDFRNKLKERLGRTAYFVAATTYGSHDMAIGAIRYVNTIHSNITGIDPQGQPYAANEPELIRWVHLAEASSFLSSYQHLCKKSLTESECDQYILEMAQIGHLLGAIDLPLTWKSTKHELARYRNELKFDKRAKEICQVVQNYPSDVFDKPLIDLTLKAAFDVMPVWVLQMIEKEPSCALQVQATKHALKLCSEPIQWMLDQRGVCAVARKRVMAGFAHA